MELFKILGTIAIDNENAIDAIDETTGKASGAKTKMVDAFKKVGTAVATYFAIDKIADFGAACLEAAANTQAMESQFTQVFGELKEQAAGNLADIAENAGIAENRMKSSYTKIAAFAKTTGMETADALSIADRAMIAVADSAAFYDRSLEETTESLQSFLKGNYENDAALGLSCTETTRNAAANELYGKSFQELSESQKQLTLLKMVEDANALSGALGQAARESDTWTNQTGNLKQAWTDFKAIIGGAFLEPAINGITKVTEVVQQCSEKVPVLIEWFKNVYDRVSVYFPAIKQTFTDIWTAAQHTWKTVGQPIWDMINSAVEIVKNAFAERMPEIREFVSGCFADISAFWENNLKPCFEAIGNFIENVLAPIFKTVFETNIKGTIDTVFKAIKSLWNDTLKPVFTGITDFLTGVFTQNWEQAWNGLVSILKGIVNGVINGIEFMINGAINCINGLINGINKLVGLAGDLLGISISIPLIPAVELPRLEEGGVLEAGQVGLLEGNGAEAVVPLERNKKWISAVARDMDSVGMGGSDEIRELKEAFTDFVEVLPEMLADAFATMRFDVNNREFARLVKAVE